MTQYYNLLIDSLRNGYKQVIQIYDKIAMANNEGKVINVCTGYLNNSYPTGIKNMKVFLRGKYIPIVYKSAFFGWRCYETAKKILKTYSKWLELYDKTQSDDAVREAVEDHLEEARLT